MAGIMALISGIGWQDIVDITLNSYIMFRMYVLFRGTNAFRVLVGIILLWFSQRIAVSLGLVLTSWALQAITAVAALIIIVVFRNEIRSVLQTRNLKAILWGFPQIMVKTPIDIIAESVFALAERRMGALVIIPGRDDISDRIHSGITWSGKVSQEMLMSVFWRDNPVHDGAAIVSGDRISEVGVILPLSQRHDLPSYMGTRHRAAIGLAENTDALVIVVSEERGTVSLAKGSILIPIRSREDLVDILGQHVQVHGKWEQYLRREKRELSIAAAVSVLFVAGIWFGFARGVDTLISLDVPVEYVNRDSAMVLIDSSVHSIRVQLSGSGALVRSIRPGQVQVTVDIGTGVPGHNAFNLTPDNVSIPPGLMLRKIEPSVIEADLDVQMQKTFPIQVDWAGKLPVNLRLVSVKLDPEYAVVQGGAQQLEKITTIYTEPVLLDQTTQSGTLKANPVLPYTALTLLSPGGAVHIDYEMRKRKPSL